MINRANFFGRQEKGLTYYHMAVITACCLILIIGLGVGQKYRTGRLQSQLSQVQDQIQNFKRSHGGLLGKGAGGPILTIAGEMNRAPPWPDILTAISGSLMDGVWLESLKGKSDDKVREILIQGTAFEAALVPGLINHLRGFPVFARVQLLSTEVSGNIDAPFRFRIKGTVRSGK